MNTSTLIGSVTVQVPESPTTIYNPHNPFDQVGSLHNEGVQFVGDALGWRNRTIDEAVGMVEEFLRAKYPGSTFGEVYRAQGGMIKQIVGAGASHDLPSQLGFSRRELAYYHRLMAIVDAYDATNAVIIAQQVKALENKLLRENHISQSMKDVLLMGTAVARHSAYYWETQRQNPGFMSAVRGNAGVATAAAAAPKKGPPPPPSTMDPRTKDILKADVTTAIAVGVPSAVALGPAAIVPALGSGIIASEATFVYELLFG